MKYGVLSGMLWGVDTVVLSMALLLTTTSWTVSILRLRTVRLPAPDGARPAYS